MKFNGIELEGAALQEHILKWQTTGTPAARHNAPLWQDIHDYFVGFFTEKDWAPGIEYDDAETLIRDLEVRFHGTYDLEHIRKMLQTEYKKKPGHGHAFLREDFIKPVTI